MTKRKWNRLNKAEWRSNGVCHSVLFPQAFLGMGTISFSPSLLSYHYLSFEWVLQQPWEHPLTLHLVWILPRSTEALWLSSQPCLSFDFSCGCLTATLCPDLHVVFFISMLLCFDWLNVVSGVQKEISNYLVYQWRFMFDFLFLGRCYPLS